MTSGNIATPVIIQPAEGVHVSFNIPAGTATITKVERFAIAPTTIEFPLLDFLDFAAQLTLEITKLQRAAMVRMAATRAQ